jgi:hypothetical protein
MGGGYGVADATSNQRFSTCAFALEAAISGPILAEPHWPRVAPWPKGVLSCTSAFPRPQREHIKPSGTRA